MCPVTSKQIAILPGTPGNSSNQYTRTAWRRPYTSKNLLPKLQPTSTPPSVRPPVHLRSCTSSNWTWSAWRSWWHRKFGAHLPAKPSSEPTAGCRRAATANRCIGNDRCGSLCGSPSGGPAGDVPVWPSSSSVLWCNSPSVSSWPFPWAPRRRRVAGSPALRRGGRSSRAIFVRWTRSIGKDSRCRGCWCLRLRRPLHTLPRLDLFKDVDLGEKCVK